jgi:OHCU decarboxylase
MNGSTSVSLALRLNDLDDDSLKAILTQCCAAQGWVHAMINARPYVDDAAILKQAVEVWERLQPSDWLEAFLAHPKIGDVDSLRAKYASTRDWATNEQAGVNAASDNVLRRLSELNREYEAKFGYIFIVCATGKTAEEMLAILESRLPNEPSAELRTAAQEQLKITLIRLQKLA